jgi:PAS domain S-box-containing protein
LAGIALIAGAASAAAFDEMIRSGRFPRRPIRPIIALNQMRPRMSLSGTLAQAILATTSDAIIATDREGVIRFWNPGAERIFGFDAKAAVGRSLDIIIPERLRKRHWDGYRRVMQSGESRYGHGDILAVPGLTRDGVQISVEFTIVPLKDADGAMTGMAAIMRDVTKRFEEVRALKRRLAEAAKVAG